MTQNVSFEQDSPSIDLAALCQLSKIDSIGAISAGIAHDFNNLLTPLIFAIGEIQRDLSRSTSQSRKVEHALACAERAQRLVHRMLNFTRIAPTHCASVNIADVIDGMRDIFSSSLLPGMYLEVDLAPRLPAITIDSNQLETALLNLVINARDAMTGGGKITICASEDVFLPADRNAQKIQGMVRISVSDTGDGMDEATLRRAAEPFFSTKEVGKGTGLGLPLVCAVVQQTGGYFSITSKSGLGTTIDLWFPIKAAVD